MTQTPEKTLRDEFAMAALNANLQAATVREETKNNKRLMAVNAYEYADAMLAERMK